MERPAFELDEMLKENGDKCGDVLSRLLRGGDELAVVCVGEADANGLVDEEDVGVIVPGLGVDDDLSAICVWPTRSCECVQ